MKKLLMILIIVYGVNIAPAFAINYGENSDLSCSALEYLYDRKSTSDDGGGYYSECCEGGIPYKRAEDWDQQNKTADKCCVGKLYFDGLGSVNKCCESPGNVYEQYEDDYECCEEGNVVIPMPTTDNKINDCFSCSKVLRKMNSLEGNEDWNGLMKSALQSLFDEYCPEEQPDGGDDSNPASAVGIQCSIHELTYGQCKFNIYDTLGIRESVRAEGDPTSVGLFMQDIVLSATMFIGTIVTIALVISGLMFVFSGASSSLKSKAKSGIINAIIGLLIVASSYAVIRLVQFIARGT